MARKNRYEFRPDKVNNDTLGKLLLTQQQFYRLLRWVLLSAVCLAGLIFQDAVMSRFHLFGASTDLVPALIFAVCILQGGESGCIFALAASLIYHFSGSAPGAFAVALITILGIGAAMFRQLYWHRNERSILLCTGLALMIYELGVFLGGLFLELTHFGRVGAFFMTGLLSCVLLLPLYPLIDRIGRIGGTEWKE